MTEITGDFFAQNTDVTQPGPIAPWYAVNSSSSTVCTVYTAHAFLLRRYERYGHSLTAVDTDGDGKTDMMVLLGGYSSSPSNDQWVTRDGVHWM